MILGRSGSDRKRMKIRIRRSRKVMMKIRKAQRKTELSLRRSRMRKRTRTVIRYSKCLGLWVLVIRSISVKIERSLLTATLWDILIRIHIISTRMETWKYPITGRFHSTPVTTSRQRRSHKLLVRFPAICTVSTCPPVFHLSDGGDIIMLLSGQMQAFFRIWSMNREARRKVISSGTRISVELKDI